MTEWTVAPAFLRVVEALERGGSRVTGNGRQRKAQCPNHDDRVASLSVTQGESRVLLWCHSPECTTDAIVAALKLTWADLFDGPPERGDGNSKNADTWAPWQKDGRCTCAPIARYDYADEDGHLLFQVVRGEHKEFSQRRPDPASPSGWRWSLGDTRRVLYHLPQILAAPPEACVFVTEGEKDVHALEAAGEIATCNPQGAGKWRPEYAGVLAGRDVLVVADKDPAGRTHAREVVASLEGTARSCWIVEAAEGKDAADHLAAGHTVSEFAWWSR
jgi:hypothetical protein